jgi:hypothetical protein
MSIYKKYLVSFFDHLKNINPSISLDIEDIFLSIKNGEWKTIVDECFLDLSKKKNLPCFTPTGIFKQRNSTGIIKYSGLICLDIDSISDPESLKEFCKNISWVWAAFITPSKRGLKVIVQTDADLEFFQTIEADVALAFYRLSGYLRDEKCKDLARVQFVSYDPNIYINSNPIKFEKRSH